MIIYKQRLPEPIAEGGEGFIYKVNNDVYKIFKEHVDVASKKRKIEVLMKKNLPTTIVKPLELLEDSSGNFLGYRMRQIKGEEMKKLSNKKFVQLHDLKEKDIIELLLEIKETLKVLHREQIIIGDLNESNIIFTEQKEVFFIDCDSWSVEGIACDVCMESFKDPNLHRNEFTKETDYYAFAILVFKTLTRLHPFGGVVKPEMDLIERMEKKISVLERDEIIVPKNIMSYRFFSPYLTKELKEIYENGKRILIDEALNEFYEHLTRCTMHGGDYYAKYNACPICVNEAKLIISPVKINHQTQIPAHVLFEGNDVLWVWNESMYVNKNKQFVHRKTGKKVGVLPGEKVFFSEDGQIIYKTTDEKIDILNKSNTYSFVKKHKTKVQIRNNKCYFIENNNALIELTMGEKGNALKQIGKVSNNHHFHVQNEREYLLVNRYGSKMVLNVSSHFITLSMEKKIDEIYSHYDEVKKQWLLIIGFVNGTFETYVIKDGEILYKTEEIHYLNDIKTMAFANGIIFKAGNGVIKAFDYVKNQYKDFESDFVLETSGLIRKGTKFIVINEKNIIELG